ncbi:hypothetical protein FKM82_000361 [Ascaphus truei]
MSSNKVFPVSQDYDTFSVSTEWNSRTSAHSHQEKDCNCCPTRRCFGITGLVLLILGVIAAVTTIGIIYGIPERQNSFTRQCKTASNKIGFLCDDRATCIAASALCDGKVDCVYGEDESSQYCAFRKTWCSDAQTKDLGHTLTTFVTQEMTVGTVQMNQHCVVLSALDGDATRFSLPIATAYQKAVATTQFRIAQTGVMRFHVNISATVRICTTQMFTFIHNVWHFDIYYVCQGIKNDQNLGGNK